MARKEKKYHFIYKTTNMLSGRYYIGMHSTDDLDDGYLGSGNRLRLAVRKHGRENFVREILEFYDSREELKIREEEIIDLNEIAKEDCMNLVVGGGGFMLDEHHYECSKAGGKSLSKKRTEDKKLAEMYSLMNSNNLKKAHENGKLKYDNFNNKYHSEETKLLMSESHVGKGTGNANSQFGTCWVTKNGLNKKIKKEEIGEYLNNDWEKGRK